MNKNLLAILIIFSGVGLCTLSVAAEDKGLEQKEIGQTVTSDVKSILKPSCLDLLASSELVTWGEFKSRIDAVKKAIDLLVAKYPVELKGEVSAPVVPAVTPEPVKLAEVTIAQEAAPVEAPVQKPVETPVVAQVVAPAPKEVPAVEKMPEAVKAPEVVATPELTPAPEVAPVAAPVVAVEQKPAEAIAATQEPAVVPAVAPVVTPAPVEVPVESVTTPAEVPASVPA